MIKLLVNKEEIAFETTIFPDGTSQVWKIAQNLFDDDDIEILWLFENEAEVFHVCQLAQLTQTMSGQEDSTLICPYLPYGRQDKDISNKASFALSTFVEILYTVNICRIETFDAHSYQQGTGIYSKKPNRFHAETFKHDAVCFPDKGAAERYKNSFPNVPVLFCEKIRDQLTGNILGLKVICDTPFNNKSILIVDDICDGGMTFIKVAEALQRFTPKQIDLAVSHGLFSKGKQVLHDAGITNIFTTNSLLRNPEGFKVW